MKSGASGKRSTAAFILDQSIYTGGDPAVGHDDFENIQEGDVGAHASVVYSNAVLYKDACVGMDSQAISDLGNVTDSDPYYILK